MTNLGHEKPQQIIGEPNIISFQVFGKVFYLNHRFIIDLIIAILIITDTFLLFMLDFSNVNSVTVQFINNFDLVVCFVLFCDFTYRFRSAEDKKAFLKDKYNLISIIAMIPINIFIFRLFRYIKILPLLYKGFIHFNRFLKETNLNWSVGILIISISSGTLLFYIFEHGVNGHVQSLWDSFLYVMPTIVTAGSNEIYPQTLEGTIIGIALMVTGIITFGLFTASIASMFVKSRENNNDLDELILTSKHLENEIKELKRLLNK